MRLLLHLQTPKGSILPFNYEYAISAWIYKTLAKADPVFATWLHDKGYSLEDNHRKFKFFTFSKIQLSYRVLPRRGLLLQEEAAQLTLSFLIDKAMQDFVLGIFKEQLLGIRIRGGNIDFRIVNVEVLPTPVFQPVMRFRAATPIFMSKRGEDISQAIHISPDDEGYARFFINNLREKAKTLGVNIPTSLTNFQALNRPKSSLLRIGTTEMRAFSFDFILVAPEELTRIGYFAGFGGKNSSLGLGFCEILK